MLFISKKQAKRLQLIFFLGILRLDIMERAKKLLEIEALAENLMKKQKNISSLKLKILFFASLYENLSVSMIIEKIGIKKSNFALMSAELEKEGLVEIANAEIDRRCRVLRLTEKGKALLQACQDNISQVLGTCNPEVDRALDVLSDFLNKRI